MKNFEKDIKHLLIELEAKEIEYKELAEVELSFESGEDMFEGLMNVVEALGKIHEINFEEIEQTKTLFVK